MGAYIYMLQGPKTKALVDIEGVIHEVGLLKFLYKPWHCSFWPGERNLNRPYEATIARMEKRWQGKTFPKFVVVGNEFKQGASVLEWKEGWISVCDTPNMGGLKYIGHLLQQNGKVWVASK